MDWLTPGGREHVIIGASPVGADRQLLGGLAGAVLPEHVDRAGVDADGARSAGLSRAFDPRPANNGRRAGDAHLMSGEIDVAPAQVEQLTAAGTRVGRQVVESEQAMAPG